MALPHRALALGVLTPLLVAGLLAPDLLSPVRGASLPVAVPRAEAAEPVPHWVPRAPVAPRPAARKAPAPAPRPVVVRQARRVVHPSVPRPFTVAEAEAVGRAAYARVNHPVPAGWRIVFAVYRGSWQGLADTGTRQVTVWVRPTDTVARVQVTVAHELGHVLDYTTLTDADRQRYLAMRGRSDCRDPWYPRNGTSDYASPAGDFAEVYALWRGGRGDFRSRFAPAPADLGPFVRFFADLEARQRQV